MHILHPPGDAKQKCKSQLKTRPFKFLIQFPLKIGKTLPFLNNSIFVNLSLLIDFKEATKVHNFSLPIGNTTIPTWLIKDIKIKLLLLQRSQNTKTNPGCFLV